MRHGRHLGGRAHEPHDGLVPDAHAQDVVAAEGAVLSPVQRSIIVDEGVEPVGPGVVVAYPQPHRENVPDVAIADEVDDSVVHL